MESQCTNDGTLRLTITFKPGTNPDIAQVLVQNRVAIAVPKLPEDVRRLGVVTKKQSTAILLVVNLFAKNQAKTDEEIFEQQLAVSRHANLQVNDELARIDGVGDVGMFGNRDYAMRVWLNTQRMTDLDLAPAEVVDAIRKQNVQVAAGQIGQPPVPKGQNFQLVINTQGRLKTEQQFKDIVLKTGADGEALVQARGRGPRRTRCQGLRHVERARWPARGRHPHLSTSRRECLQHRSRRPREDEETPCRSRLARRHRVRHRVRPHRIHQGVGQRRGAFADSKPSSSYSSWCWSSCRTGGRH